MRPETPTALVTGAAAGIGLATMRVLIDAGWRVAGFDRDAEAVARAKAELPHDATRLRLETLDVTDSAASKRRSRASPVISARCGGW